MDEKQFVEVFNLLRDRTKDWTEFTPELFIEDNRMILVVRCALRLPQKKFAEKLGCTRTWVRSTEAGRNRIIHLKPANRWCGKIEELIKNSEISLENSLEFFKQFQFVRNKELPEKLEKLSPMSDLTIRELRKRLEAVKTLTNRFSIFDPKILVSNPQNILIFRLIFGLSIRDFAKEIKIWRDNIRNWEHLTTRIKLQSAIRAMSKIEIMFKNIRPNTSFENVKRNFKLLLKGQGNRSFNLWVKNGLRLARNQKPTETESRILETLKNNGLDAEIHGIIEGFKKQLCIDFVIPNSTNPKIVIETFDFSLRSKSVSNSKIRIREIDHRFQSIKLRNPSIKTILVIKFKNKKFLNLKLARETISSELLNTDHLIINNLEKILTICKKSNLSHPSSETATFFS